jgi:deoxycytidylate deaminase
MQFYETARMTHEEQDALIKAAKAENDAESWAS